MQSLAVADPLVHRVLVVSDGVPAGLREDPRLAGVEIRDGADFCDALDALTAYYTPIELNTALKPFVLGSLLRRADAGTVTYLDPDIIAYRPLEAIRTALETASIALTPHLRTPLPGPASPNDHVILRAGIYNLGFIGVRAEADTITFADWWADHCRFDCRVAFDEGLFTDQRWVDLAPGFFESTAILRKPVFNLAYWSLPGRALEQSDDGWRVDGEPLVFFHFSGFDPARPDLLSRHQDRLKVDGGPLAAILKDYAGRLMGADYRRWSVEPYGFRAFEDGRSITPLMRRALLRRARLGVRVDRTGGGETLDAIEPGWETAGLPSVTQLMAQAWRELPGAEERFDPASQAGRLAFHAFFQKQGQSLGADDRARDAAARCIAPPVAQAAPDTIDLAPWTGPARQSSQWFSAAASDDDVERAVVAAWRSNPALRAEFPAERLSDLALVTRCVGQEALAGRFDPALLSEDAWARLLALPAAKLGALAEPTNAEAPALLRPDLAEVYVAFGLSERARWPEAVKSRLRAPWIQGGDTRLLGRWPRLLDAIWAARPDLQGAFDLRRPLERLRYLNWFARQGARELNLSIAALPAALRGNPLFIAVRLRDAKPAPAEPRCGTANPILAIVTRPSRALPTPPIIGEAVFLDPENGAWHDRAGGRIAAPSRIKWLVHAGSPDDWAASSMILARQGVLIDHVAGLVSHSDHPLSPSDWALGFVDEVWTFSAGVETTIGFRPIKRILTLDAEASPLVAP